MNKDIFSDDVDNEADSLRNTRSIYEEETMTVQKKNKTKIAIIVIAVIIAMSGMMVGGYYIGVNSGIGQDLPLLLEAYKYMKKYYYTDITWSEFQVYAASAFAGSLDSYTGLTYFSSMTEPSESAGLMLSRDNFNRVLIDFVYPESNAYNTKAVKFKSKFTEGYIQSYLDDNNNEVQATNLEQSVYLEEGDRIYAVNGKRVENATSNVYMDAINTTVNGSSSIMYIDVIKTDSTSKDLDGYYCFAIEKSLFTPKQAYYTSTEKLNKSNVGMIRLMSFESTAAEDFASCVLEFLTDNNKPNKLILDLRGNGGGDSQICGYIAQFLLTNPTGTQLNLAKYVYNNGKTKDAQTWFTSLTAISGKDILPSAVPIKNTLIDFECAILADDGSASCSELLIGAMQYYNGSKLIGETTYGKGVAQQSFEVGNGSNRYRLLVTNGFYYMPTLDESGQEAFTYNIHGTGISPLNENKLDATHNKLALDKAIQRAFTVLGAETIGQI